MKTCILAMMITATSLGAFGQSQDNSCFEPGRQTNICLKMKHLFGDVQLLGAQRELANSDYGMFELVAADLENVLIQLSRQMHSLDHAEKIADVLDTARTLRQQAATTNYRTFQTANQINAKCRSCHDGVTPEPSYDVIFQKDWASIAQACNQTDKNPYVCRKMHYLATGLNYFSAASMSDLADFRLAKKVAVEMQQTATSLINLGEEEFHTGGKEAFAQLLLLTREIEQAAEQGDSEIYQKAMGIRSVCSKCHSGAGE